MAEVFKEKIRTDHICKNCRVHTLQKKIFVKSKGIEVWRCNECGNIQEDEKTIRT